MRIVLVSQEYPPQTARGGIGSQTYLKAHGLAALGHELHVIARSTTPRSTATKDGPVRVSRIPGFESRLPVTMEPVDWLTYSAEVAVAIAALHARSPIDVIDVPEWGCEGYIHLLNRPSRHRIPTVVQLHGPLVMRAHTLGQPAPDSEFYRIGTVMEGACVRLADAIYSSSAYSAQWCAKHYGLQGVEIPVLHAGIDTTLFAPRDVPKAGRPTIIFVGTIARQKGVELLLDATIRLVKDVPMVQLRLVGQGEESFVQGLRARAQAAGLPGLLELPGAVEQEALPVELSQAHIFAAPSAYESGPGFAYLEAMACGLPVVACEANGVSEVVLAGQTGLLVPPGNVEALVNALRLLLTYPKRRETMAQAARRYALERADSGSCITRIEAFYRRVLEPTVEPDRPAGRIERARGRELSPSS